MTREIGLMIAPYLPFFALLLLGLVAGSIAANKHERSLQEREQALGNFMLTTIEHPDGSDGRLVTGSTVIAFDFFRRLAIVLRKLVGGRFRIHERMMDRARREAILRMAEQAKDQGANAVHNIRLLNTNLGHSGSAMGGCEVLAYGTAVWDA